jgi:hypothetical protein
MYVETSRVASAPLGSGRRRQSIVIDAAKPSSGRQRGQLTQAERAFQAGIER